MENGNRFPKAETPVTQKKTELPKRQANGKAKRQANGEANGRPQHTPAQAAPPHSQRDIWAHGNRRGESFFGGRRNLKFQSSRQGAEKSAYRVVFQRAKGSGFERGGNAGGANGTPRTPKTAAHPYAESGGDYMPWSIRSPFRRLPWAFRHFSQQ